MKKKKKKQKNNIDWHRPIFYAQFFASIKLYFAPLIIVALSSSNSFTFYSIEAVLLYLWRHVAINRILLSISFTFRNFIFFFIYTFVSIFLSCHFLRCRSVACTAHTNCHNNDTRMKYTFVIVNSCTNGIFFGWIAVSCGTTPPTLLWQCFSLILFACLIACLPLGGLRLIVFALFVSSLEWDRNNNNKIAGRLKWK